MLLQMPINKNKTIQELADAALKQVLDDTTADGVTIREWLKKISSGEYQPVKQGSWSEKQVAYRDSFGDLHFGFKCSKCGAIISKSNYCGNCGAKMNIDTGDYYTPKDGEAEE